MIARCYLEITNICNLDCVFCPKNARPKRLMTMEEFDRLTNRLVGEVRFLYFHLMGEPMLHPHLADFVRMARDKGFVPVLTTNGTLLDKNASLLAEYAPRTPQTPQASQTPYLPHPLVPPSSLPLLHKLQISLHSHEGNGRENPEVYMKQVMTYALDAAHLGTIVVLRLWNQGGLDSANAHLLELAARYVPQPWTERYDGWKLTDRIYIEYDHLFEWPDEDHAEYGNGEEVFCYALRNQLGVLVDGTVVPCCLDHEGSVPLGNLHGQTLAEVLSSPRAQALYNGFSHHHATESFCRRCGYASVTKRFRKDGK